MRLILLLVTLVLSAALFAQTPPRGGVRFINPPTLTQPVGYSQVVEVRGGRTIYVAGQAPRDRTGAIVGKGDLAAQTRQAFENLRAALASADADLDDIVKMTTYVTDITQLEAFRTVRAQFLGDRPPASSVVEVERLGSPDALIQVEAIAVVAEAP